MDASVAAVCITAIVAFVACWFEPTIREAVGADDEPEYPLVDAIGFHQHMLPGSENEEEEDCTH